MLQIDNQVITLVVLILCIVICFKTSSTVLCTIIGSVLVSCMYKNKQGNKNESIINFPSLLKIYPEKPRKIKVTETEKQKDKFHIDGNSIRLLSEQEAEDEIETEMEIELNSNKIKDETLEKQELLKSKEPVIVPEVKKQEETKEQFITKDDVPVICLGDNIIDGDERIAYNSIHRNEPTRVIIGMGKAYQNLSRYVKEEVEEIEGREWWGNNEY